MYLPDPESTPIYPDVAVSPIEPRRSPRKARHGIIQQGTSITNHLLIHVTGNWRVTKFFRIKVNSIYYKKQLTVFYLFARFVW